jgi:SpoVK/Ycf46/Vps4 family AAA+-type ATPase
MARNDLITRLIRAGVLGDQDLLNHTVEALIAEEQSQRHHIFAEKLKYTLQEAQSSQKQKRSAVSYESGFSKNSDEVKDFLHEIRPDRSLSQIHLTDDVRYQCNELIEEHLCRSKLRSFSLEPRNRVLLVGPPGNGKTSVARSIGYELGLPVYILRYETVIGSFLGETSSRLRTVFEFIRERPCVFFLDEFDTIAKERGDEHETGEIKRVVSTLLLQLDDLPSHNLILAATNHSELIDRAAWRRFQILIELPSPNLEQIKNFLHDQTSTSKLLKKYDFPILARSFIGYSYSDIELFLEDIKRRIVVEDGKRQLKNIVDEKIERMQNSYRPNSSSPSHEKAVPTESDKSRKNRTIKGQFEIF